MSKINIQFLFQDTINFFLNRIYNIILISILSAIIYTILEMLLLPEKNKIALLYNAIKNSNVINIDIINFVKDLSLDQQNTLFRVSFANLISNLISSTILFGILITEIRLIQTYHRSISVIHAIISSIPIFPKLLFLIFLINLFTQIGFIFVIFPGIIFFGLLIFSPIVLILAELNIIQSIYISINMSVRYFKVLIPPILLWFIIKIVILLLVKQFNITSFFCTVLINSVNNLSSSCLLIFLCRLYILIKSNNHKPL